MVRFGKVALVLFLTILSFQAIGAEAASTTSYLDAEKATAVLVKITVLAILLEVALTSLFNWRWFLRWADGRGMKMPITLLAAVYFVYSIGGTNNDLHIDVVAEILNATTDSDPYSETTLGIFITALIIAGGSTSVFMLFEKLGLRNPIKNQQRAEVMRAKARLAIQVLRTGQIQNNAAITVLLDGVIVGTITEGEQQLNGSGGIEIEPGGHKLELFSYDANNNKLVSPATSFSIRAGATLKQQIRLTANALA